MSAHEMISSGALKDGSAEVTVETLAKVKQMEKQGVPLELLPDALIRVDRYSIDLKEGPCIGYVSRFCGRWVGELNGNGLEKGERIIMRDRYWTREGAAAALVSFFWAEQCREASEGAA